MSNKPEFKFAASITAEPLAQAAPILFRGDPASSIAKAKTIGYDAVEIHLRDPQKLDREALFKACEENEISVAALATGPEVSLNGFSMLDPSPDRRKELMKNLVAHVDLASELKALVIMGMLRGQLGENPDKDKALFEAQLLELADYAKEKGVTLVLEAINFYVNNYLCSTIDTCDYIRSLGKGNILLHIDTHHMNIEDYDPVDSTHYAG